MATPLRMFVLVSLLPLVVGTNVREKQGKWVADAHNSSLFWEEGVFMDHDEAIRIKVTHIWLHYDSFALCFAPFTQKIIISTAHYCPKRTQTQLGRPSRRCSAP